MEINRAMALRLDLQRDIQTMINKFEEDTGCSVTGINIVKTCYIGFSRTMVSQVNLDVTL